MPLESLVLAALRLLGPRPPKPWFARPVGCRSLGLIAPNKLPAALPCLGSIGVVLSVVPLDWIEGIVNAGVVKARMVYPFRISSVIISRAGCGVVIRKLLNENKFL